MLVGCVVADQLVQHSQPAPVCLAHQLADVPEPAVNRVDLGEVRDVVSVVTQRRGVEGQQPERINSQLLQVVELLGEPREVTDAVRVAVVERADMHLVDDRVLVPERVLVEAGRQAKYSNTPARGRRSRKTWPETPYGLSSA